MFFFYVNFKSFVMYAIKMWLLIPLQVAVNRKNNIEEIKINLHKMI